jgi:hypothetical protein
MNLPQGLRRAMFSLLFCFATFDGSGQIPDDMMGRSFPGGMMTGRSFSQPDRFPTCVAYGNGIFVAAGYGRMILVSKDGANWLNRSTSITNTIIGINFTTEIYSVGGDSLTLVIPSDASGKVEVQQKSFHFRAVGFGNNTFVIL